METLWKYIAYFPKSWQIGPAEITTKHAQEFEERSGDDFADSFDDEDCDHDEK